jgi:menaquinone-9 beta-reductase
LPDDSDLERQCLIDKELLRQDLPIQTNLNDLDEEWDVVVIGAGPAGCTAAVRLGGSGLRVLLVDKQQFPRNKLCGCCLSEATLALIDKYKLIPGLHSIGHQLTELHLTTPVSSAAVQLTSAKALSRSSLDTALAITAMRVGVRFCHGVTATVMEMDQSNTAHLRVELSGDGVKIIRSSVVLVADGLSGTSLRKLPSLTPVNTTARLVGAGTIIADAPASYRAGIIYMACTNSGYVGAVRLEDGSLDVAAALDVNAVRRSRGPAALVDSILHATKLDPIEALRAAPWRGTVSLSRRRRNLSAERIFVIGDAAGYVEPFTGEGIGWAISAGVLVSDVAAAGVSNWHPGLVNTWNRAYDRHMIQRQEFCKVTSMILRNSFLRESCIAILSSIPSLARPFIQKMNQKNMEESVIWH